MARKKCKGTELSVFKGREARLNRAVFQIFSTKGPQTIYDIHKHLKILPGMGHLRYANVNKRIKALQAALFIQKRGEKKTKAGFAASVYDLTQRAHLALLLEYIGLEEAIKMLDDSLAGEVLAVLFFAISSGRNMASKARKLPQ